MKGTYCLIIELRKNTKIKVGAIGQIEFNPGFYIYIGSAMNSLSSRINRHLSSKKKKHWHIDYLLLNKNTEIKEILFNISEKRIECELAKEIAKNGKEINKFGSSDCKCNSHLIYYKKYEDATNNTENTYNSLKMEYHDLKYFKKIK